MREVEDSLRKADRNELLADHLAVFQNRFTEWELTILFYAALHYMNAYLANQGYNPSSHHSRNTLAQNLTGVGEEYQNLYRLSINARYDFVSFSTEEVEEIKARYFRKVKEEILALLSSGQEN